MGNRILKAGTRGSALAMLQTRDTLERFAALFPALAFESVTVETPGDRDLTTDLRQSPGDFFTRDLDDALREGRIDLAVHSAKDLPDPLPGDLDWFWLPWREDPRDAWVLPEGRRWADLPARPVVGVSSARREACTLRRFPEAVLKPIRGTIQSRLAQLDAGGYDALLMAGAALNRLELAHRVAEWVPLDELPVPEGQGRLAVTFRLGDPVLTALRAYFVKAVRFVGAGVGSADYCTWGGINDLRQADVCLYDVLMDDHLLTFLPKGAERIFVGKRCGEHAVRQPDITSLIARKVRQGHRVVRLKGGDPGLFGRLAEETDELDRLALPYRVRAGVSALTVATTGTGMLLTRRGVSRGVAVMTPRAEGGAVSGVAQDVRLRLPLVLFMSVRVAAEMAGQLLDEGWDAATPAAAAFNAGADDEQVVRTTLGGLRAGALAALDTDAPGLLVIGEAAACGFRRDTGALRGCRVLVTCSEALLEKAAARIIDFGGVPLLRPLIRLTPCAAAAAAVERLAAYDWLVLTSPSAVHFLMAMARGSRLDWRRMPRLMACGPGSAAACESHGFTPELTPPMAYSAEGLAAVLRECDFAGQSVLRLRSEKAGPLLAEVLRAQGAQVDDVQLYANEPIIYPHLPVFDAVFFASASAVEAFAAQAGGAALAGKTVVTIGNPTTAALAAHGCAPDVVAAESTVDGAIEALAREMLNRGMVRSNQS
ncbi:MAG: hydroxymethylbilane synthase [Kiritimatiellae bacterium]|nr:hydroxymethylbilane synthase [Kiritimatiellia bacterium]MDD4441741.1 hydroxymethylbilane synthase [Kiritimatiellia bacterium]